MLLTAAARRTAARRAGFNSGGFLLTQRVWEVPLSGPVVLDIYSNYDYTFKVFAARNFYTGQ